MFDNLLAIAIPKPEEIDVVLCTHLHFDHVSWNTKLVGGEWIPTFPNARYLYAEEEYNYWKEHPEKEIADDHAGISDSVQPILEAGLADLVPENHIVTEGVSLIPTPGHTPAHECIFVESQGDKAVITGDVLHHPCQIAHTDWETIADTDPIQATETRQALLNKYVGSQTLIIGSHFASPTAGYLERDGKELKLV